MPINYKKNILLFVLLSLSLLSQAQDDEGKKASIVVDSTDVTEKVAEGDQPPASKQYFNKKGDTLSVTQRTVPGQEVKKLEDDEDFWYVNTTIKKGRKGEVKPEKENGQKGQKGKNEPVIKEQQSSSYQPLSQRSWFQTLLWIVIIGAFATGLVFYLGSSNVGLFRKKNIITGGNEEDLITEDIFAINYQKEIDKAAAQGNYRLAIRLLFLRLLKNMSEKNIIRYKQDKTNLDYLLELQPTAYYNNFFRVTRNYEYSWYGLFPVSEDAYQVIRNDFDQFDKELR